MGALVLFLAFVFVLVSYGGEHDVAYYRAHDAERSAMLAECDRRAGEVLTHLHPDCLNARRAAGPSATPEQP